MKLQTTAHCFRVVSLRPYYYRSRHSTRNVPKKKFVTYRTRSTYTCTDTHTHMRTQTHTHTHEVYTQHTRSVRGRAHVRHAKLHASRCVERARLKIKWKCIPDERNIVLSKGHVLYVCVVHSLNKNYI